LPQQKSKKTSKKLDPKKYTGILKTMKLKELYLESCSVDHKRENVLKSKGIQILVKDRASFTQEDDKVKVFHKYFLTGKSPEMEKDYAIKISVSFCLRYITTSTIEKEFFDIFKDINLPLTSYPYFREFVQNTVQRMNIPPITLPLARAPFGIF
jgi:hypothetical protein